MSLSFWLCGFLPKFIFWSSELAKLRAADLLTQRDVQVTAIVGKVDDQKCAEVNFIDVITECGGSASSVLPTTGLEYMNGRLNRLCVWGVWVWMGERWLHTVV